MNGEETMDQASFKALCRATSIALQSQNPEALGETNLIEVDGVRAGLFFDEDTAPDRIICYIDIGPLPPADREEILGRLLAINLLTGTKTAGVYALDLQTDNVIFTQHFLYPDLMTGEELAGILEAYSVHAANLKHSLLDPNNHQPLPDMLARSFSAGLQTLV